MRSRIYRFLCVALCALLCCQLLPATESAAESVADGVGNSPRSGAFVPVDMSEMYGRNLLKDMPNSTALLYAYDQIVEGVERVEQTVSINNGVDPISTDELELVMDLFHRDYGGDFWLSPSWSMSYSQTTAIAVHLQYEVTGAELEAERVAMETEAQKILSGITPGMSEYEKTLYIHDQLAAGVDYVETSNAHNAYGALVEGKAVCEGYAEALQYLLQRAGIQCFAAIGSSINPGTGTGEPHEWNYVRIDGKYYHVDLTWNDQGKDLFHAFFCQTDAVMQEGHAVSPVSYALPVCDSTDAFYFQGKPEKLDTYSTDSLGQLLMDNDYQVHVYIPGDVGAFRSWFEANAVAVAKKAGISGSFSYSYNWLSREFILTFISANTGKTVSGTVVSSGSNDAPVTVSLYQNGVLKYTAQVTGKTAAYTIKGVKNGTYTMTVSKQNHVDRVYTVTVAGENVKQDAQICLTGDVNQDGKVNAKDWQRVYLHVNKTQPLSDYALTCGDVTGDGKTNAKDWQRIYLHVNKTDLLF